MNDLDDPCKAIDSSTELLYGLRIARGMARKSVLSATAGLALATGVSSTSECVSDAETARWQKAESSVAETKPREPRRYVVCVDYTAHARNILYDALRRYRAPNGYEGSLTEAAWQLEQIGRKALPALDELFYSYAPEVEYFLGTIVRMPGIESENRCNFLRIAANNPEANVRSRLLELADELPDNQKSALLRWLTSAASPNDDVTCRARQLLEDSVA